MKMSQETQKSHKDSKSDNKLKESDKNSTKSPMY